MAIEHNPWEGWLIWAQNSRWYDGMSEIWGVETVATLFRFRTVIDYPALRGHDTYETLTPSLSSFNGMDTHPLTCA